jgi:GNAT superfamily N-acetyltransferase
VTSAIVIRRGVADDWLASKELRLRALAGSPQAFASTLEREVAFDEEVWRTRLERAATFFAVDPAGSLVGTVTGIDDPHEPLSREVVAMWVEPEWRGQGVGGALLDAVVEWARAEGVASIALWVADGNDEARRLYERRGFAETGQRDVIRGGLGEQRLRLALQ